MTHMPTKLRCGKKSRVQKLIYEAYIIIIFIIIVVIIKICGRIYFCVFYTNL